MSPIKSLIIVIGIVILIIVFINYNSIIDRDPEVCVSNNCFNVEIADSVSERSQGLMNRHSLGRKEGMLFIFPESGNYNFWMKDTLIPLDIIWISSDKEIVHIESVQPCITEICESYGSFQSSLYVLEINHGLTEELGISIGNKVKLP